MEKIDVGVLGATGTVGQQFIALLAGHPWFRVSWLAASERSAGKRYGDLAWRLPSELPADVARLEVAPPPRSTARRRCCFRRSTRRSPARPKRHSPRAAASSSAMRATTGWTRWCRC
jgi:hypothetical protein